MKIQKFSFPCGGAKKLISNFKNDFFRIFYGGIDENCSTRGCQIYLKFTKVTCLPLKK
jgi:hypothetical protein